MQSLLATYVLDGAGSGSTNDATDTPYNGGGSEEQMSAFTAIADLIVDRDAGDCEDNAACMKVDDANESCADKSSNSYSLQDLIELMEPF